MIMCLQNLVLIGLFVFKILNKNSILTSIKGSNFVANLPKFELIQAFSKNEGDQIKNEGARVFTRFLPLCLWGFFQTPKGSLLRSPWSDLAEFRTRPRCYNVLWMSLLSASMKTIRSKMKALEWSQHYTSIF